MKRKILIIRFSAIGDIIYTTPVVRCLKQQLPNVEIHYLTKKQFSPILASNPYIDKLHLISNNLTEIVDTLKKEQFDYVIDLHNTIRSLLIKYLLGKPSKTFKKYRLQKWLALKFKINLIPNLHLVERYLQTVDFLGIKNDHKPVDYFLDTHYNLEKLLPPYLCQQPYIAFIIGATHFIKRMPLEKVIHIIQQLNCPVVLLGGNDVAENGEKIAAICGQKTFNGCGKWSLNESVSIVKQASSVIGFDTGLTHIAEAFNKPIVSIWRSTAPHLLGVEPYQLSES